MRVSIDKGYDSLINNVMRQIQAQEPRLAVQFIIAEWAKSQDSLLDSRGSVDPAKLDAALDDLDFDAIAQHG